MKKTHTLHTVLVSTLLALLVGCSASVEVARRDVRSGMLVLQGPLMPATRLAREAMLDHCGGRFVVGAEGTLPKDAGNDTHRFIRYECAPTLQLAAR